LRNIINSDILYAMKIWKKPAMAAIKEAADTTTITQNDSSNLVTTGTTSLTTDDDFVDFVPCSEKSIVVFDVSGRIFKVRRTVLDIYPETVLSRAASELWSATNVSTLVAEAESPPQSVQKEKKKPEAIFIDRDSDRFACVIDFMRNNGIVELPVTVSRDAFLRDLEYYGFDETNIDTTFITCTIPAYEAIMKIDRLHTKFHDEILQMKLEKDFKILAYVCFCEFLQKHDLNCRLVPVANTITVKQATWNHHYNRHDAEETKTEYMLPASMSIMETKLPKAAIISGSELMQVAEMLVDTNKGKSKNMTVFNKFLSGYGFECESVENVSAYVATIKLKRID
jgi:BTB/POZ domain